MGMTITEKILARAGGVDQVRPGQNLAFKPDYMAAYDFPGYTDMMFRQMKDDMGIETVSEPDRYLLFIDHLITKNIQKEEDAHQVTRDWAQHNGVALYEGQGIGHQVITEQGYALPGKFLVHFDGHISGVGAFGALGWGIRRDLLEAWVAGKVYLDVPASTRFYLDGDFADYVDSRDLVHYIIREHGASGTVNQVVEYTGPGAKRMSIERRQTLCAMAMFSGAVSAIFNPDERTLDYARSVARTRTFHPVYSDPDAEYAAEHRLDLSQLEPQIVLPGSAKSANTMNISELAGRPVKRGYIGSCASGRIEEIRAAAEILNGRHVASGFVLNVVPTSERIRQQANEEGLLDILRKAGAQIGKPTCDYCFGYADPLQAGDTCISTGVLNIRGRMGSTEAEIYMGSAFAVAATALNGRITDPRELFPITA